MTYKNFSFYFIFGSDLIKSIHTWQKGKELLNSCSFIIFERPQYPIKEIMKGEYMLKNFIISNNPEKLMDISSTVVRNRYKKMKNPHSIIGYVTKSVALYIDSKKLYL